MAWSCRRKSSKVNNRKSKSQRYNTLAFELDREWSPVVGRPKYAKSWQSLRVASPRDNAIAEIRDHSQWAFSSLISRFYIVLQLQDKVKTLEKSLSHVVREFEAERAALVQKAEDETRSSRWGSSGLLVWLQNGQVWNPKHETTFLFVICCRAEIARLQRIIELKTKEMNRVKRLAKTILDQVSWAQNQPFTSSVIQPEFTGGDKPKTRLVWATLCVTLTPAGN